MKFVLIIGSGAVGKMTVGQDLMKITDLRLFHNHMTIEPVIDIMGYFDGPLILELRESIFRRFAACGQYGMIFTYMWAFDQQSDWDYINHVADIFARQGAEVYWVELVADQAVRLERNRTENRLAHKASKRNLAFSEANLPECDKMARLESNAGEIPFENYIRIDNTRLSPEEVVSIIRERFGL